MGSHLHFLAGILHLQSAYCLYALAACTHFSNSATTAQSRLLLFLLNWMADSGSWWSPSGCFCCSVLSSDRSLSFRRRRCSLPYSGLSDAYETKREQDIFFSLLSPGFSFSFPRRRCSLPYSGLSNAYETKREYDILNLILPAIQLDSALMSSPRCDMDCIAKKRQTSSYATALRNLGPSARSFLSQFAGGASEERVELLDNWSQILISLCSTLSTTKRVFWSCAWFWFQGTFGGDTKSCYPLIDIFSHSLLIARRFIGNHFGWGMVGTCTPSTALQCLGFDSERSPVPTPGREHPWCTVSVAVPTTHYVYEEFITYPYQRARWAARTCAQGRVRLPVPMLRRAVPSPN